MTAFATEVETYRGNHSHYIRQREERWELRSKA